MEGKLEGTKEGRKRKGGKKEGKKEKRKEASKGGENERRKKRKHLLSRNSPYVINQLIKYLHDSSKAGNWPSPAPSLPM